MRELKGFAAKAFSNSYWTGAPGPMSKICGRFWRESGDEEDL